MKRDPVLVKKVLEYVEKNGARRFKGAILIEGYERDDVIYHVQMLGEAGFILLGQETLTNAGALVLTWKGCDYLDELRGADTRTPPKKS